MSIRSAVGLHQQHSHQWPIAAGDDQRAAEHGEDRSQGGWRSTSSPPTSATSSKDLTMIMRPQAEAKQIELARRSDRIFRSSRPIRASCSRSFTTSFERDQVHTVGGTVTITGDRADAAGQAPRGCALARVRHRPGNPVRHAGCDLREVSADRRQPHAQYAGHRAGAGDLPGTGGVARCDR